MAIKYKLIKRKNLSKPDALEKYYAVFSSSGITNVRDMVEDIREFTSLTEPDILSVISALRICMQKSVSQGKSIRWDNFGTFILSLNSEGVEREEDFTDKMIKKTNIHFREGEDLSTTLRNVKYKREK